MLSGKLFVICGLSRLSARVAKSLLASNARVTLIMYDGDPPGLLPILPEGVVVRKSAAESAAETLKHVQLDQAECLLALAEGDLDNLRSTVCARSVAPMVPVVIRAFDPRLADQFEQGLNVRRAFSVSALATPAFAAAACGAELLESLRLGDEVVPINFVPITAASYLKGQTLEALEETWDVNIIAWRTQNGDWLSCQDVNPTRVVAPGDEIIVTGAPKSCMKMLAYGAGWQHRRRMGKRPSQRGSGLAESRKKRPRRQSFTWLPQLIGLLLIIVLTSIVVFKIELHLRLVDAIYFVITTLTTTGYGDITLKDAPDWVKMFGGLVMLSGGAMLGIVFSYFASVAMAERLDVTMAKRAENMSNHIVVIGMGNVGYRVTLALTELGLDVAVVELAPNPQFMDSVISRAPVLAGDARLPETLDRVGITEAYAIIACTSNDLVNVEACLQAKRMNPKIQTVARVYDDQIVQTLSSAFGIDSVLSATQIAVSSFVMAATDAAALRSITVGDLKLSAGRYRALNPIERNDVRDWERFGIQAVAFRSEDGTVSSNLSAASTYEAVVCGSEEAVRSLVTGQRSTLRVHPVVSVSKALKGTEVPAHKGE